MSNNTATTASSLISTGDQQQQQALAMAAVVCVKVLLASVTIASAATLILVTIRSKNLHGSCNLLIAANSLCILLYSLSFFTQFVALILAGPDGFSNRLCVLLQIIPKIGNYGQYVFFLLIAVDRLISVVFPVWQCRAHRQRGYLAFLCSLAFGYGLASSLASVYSAYTSEDKIVVCETGNSALQIFSDLGMALSISACVAYMALWVLFRMRRQKDLARSQNDYPARLLHSLVAMFLLDFFGWSINQIATKVLNFVGPPALQRWYIKSFVGFVTQTTLALYAPTLFLMSSEYRKALQKTFGCVPIGLTRVTTIKSNEIQLSRCNGRSGR